MDCPRKTVFLGIGLCGETLFTPGCLYWLFLGNVCQGGSHWGTGTVRHCEIKLPLQPGKSLRLGIAEGDIVCHLTSSRTSGDCDSEVQ